MVDYSRIPRCVRRAFFAALISLRSYVLGSVRISHRTGTVVVGINQAGQKQVNPTGNEIVQAGDEWLVIGSAEEIRFSQGVVDIGD